MRINKNIKKSLSVLNKCISSSEFILYIVYLYMIFVQSHFPSFDSIMKKFSFSSSIIVVLFSYVSCARILALFPIHGVSNYNVAKTLLEALAERGHDVTVVTSFVQNYSIPNFHQIDVSKAHGIATNNINFERVKKVLKDVKLNFKNMEKLSKMYCEVTFNDPRVRNLLNRKFDLVINAIFGSDCDVGFAWKLQAPLISILNARHTPWSLARVGNPSNPSYMRVIHSRASSPMNFMQRLQNTIWYLYFIIMYDIKNNGNAIDELSKKFFGSQVPCINDLVYKNTSLVFVNSHYTMDDAYPLVPNCIEIAGLHIQQPKPLPTDIKKFMDEAEHGVIYFTLGSMVRTSSFPKSVVNAFKEAFAEIPQRVLWKFELQSENMPANVLIKNWMPQNDILSHPNTKLFISHGGNSGSIEALHYGIPIIGIPLFYDQYRNILSFVEKGTAVMLDVDELTKENILRSIKTITDNEEYNKRMKKLSELFKDRPINALDNGIYWTEYVIRHKGAPHLKTAATNLPWYQYLLLDVILFLVFVVFMVVKILIMCLSFLAKFYGDLKSSKESKNSKQKKW